MCRAWCLVFVCVGGQGLGQGVGKKMEETRHPTHRRYRWWSGMLKGAVAGPLDGQTNRGSNPRPRRAPAMAHTSRPSMPLTLSGTKIVYRDWTFIGVRTQPLLSVGRGGPRQVYDVRTDQASRVPALGRVPPGCSTDSTVTRPRAQPAPLERGRYSSGSAATRVNSHWYPAPASACRVGGRAARKIVFKTVIPGS